METENLTWKKFQEGIAKIGDQIKASNYNPDCIYGKPKSGSIPAVWLAYYLDKHLMTSFSELGPKILVVDDMVGNSNTLDAQRDFHGRIASIYKEDGSGFYPQPNFYAFENGGNVSFPWERNERAKDEGTTIIQDTEGNDIEKVSMNRFIYAINEIAKTIEKSNTQIHGIYGPPKGGITPAVCLSYILDLPLVTSFSDLGPKILVVDDISDSGETLKRYEKSNSPVATLYYKRKGNKSPEPDFHVFEKEDNWILFPWETIETTKEEYQ